MNKAKRGLPTLGEDKMVSVHTRVSREVRDFFFGLDNPSSHIRKSLEEYRKKLLDIVNP